MTAVVRMFLLAQTLLFGFAALAHFGIVGNRDDAAAGTAESVIAVVLLGGVMWSLIRPDTTRLAALASQGFALLGTLVGFTLVMTVGPRTTFDVTMHGAMIVLLTAGLLVTSAWRLEGDRFGIQPRRL